MCWIVLTGQQPLTHEPLQAIGEDVGGNSLLRKGEQLPEVPAIPEHDVANDDHAPAIPSTSKVRLIGHPDRGVVILVALYKWSDRKPQSRQPMSRSRSEGRCSDDSAANFCILCPP